MRRGHRAGDGARRPTRGRRRPTSKRCATGCQRMRSAAIEAEAAAAGRLDGRERPARGARSAAGGGRDRVARDRGAARADQRRDRGGAGSGRRGAGLPATGRRADPRHRQDRARPLLGGVAQPRSDARCARATGCETVQAVAENLRGSARARSRSTLADPARAPRCSSASRSTSSLAIVGIAITFSLRMRLVRWVEDRLGAARTSPKTIALLVNLRNFSRLIVPAVGRRAAVRGARSAMSCSTPQRARSCSCCRTSRWR